MTVFWNIYKRNQYCHFFLFIQVKNNRFMFNNICINIFQWKEPEFVNKLFFLSVWGNDEDNKTIFFLMVYFKNRTRTNNFKICMEIQKKLKLPKQSWDRRMELEESICLTLGSTTKPQSSKQYGTEPSFLDNHLFTLWSSCVVKAIYSKHKFQDWILIFSNDLFSSLTWH